MFIENLIIIPARLKSTRLPGKMLKDLCGQTVIRRVYENAIKSKNNIVYMAVDSKEVEKECLTFTDNVIMTSEKLESGTERIIEALSILATKNISFKNIVNIQGDEPFIEPELINKLFESLKNSQMVSVKKEITVIKDIENINTVKVITDINDNAIYFSRLPIPCNRDKIELEELKYFKHLGIYGYTYDMLNNIANFKYSILEQSEKLEQLKVIENGYKIKMIETNEESIGIDTEEDLELARQKFIKDEK